MSLKTLIKPANVAQRRYIELLSQPKPHVVVATGAAGSGKTLLATHVGLQMLKSNSVDKIIITRPTVGAGNENLGFLPGTLEEKMAPWVRPIHDILDYYYSRSKIQTMIKEGVIEISPLAYMRGRTFENSWIICDEAQNTTASQMYMMLTRIGQKSKMVLTGDLAQSDIQGTSGLKEFLDKWDLFNKDSFDPSDLIDHVAFSGNDVLRSEVVKEIIRIYQA
jgi:phosphate starvation-inducible PhoH-like protein